MNQEPALVYGNGQCAVCHARTRRGYLMCALHWGRVPWPVRDALFDALSRWDRSEATLMDVRSAQSACVEAVTGVPQTTTLEGSEPSEQR